MTEILSPRLRALHFPPGKRSRSQRDEDTADPTTAVLVYNVSLNDMLVVTQALPELAARKEYEDGLPGLARALFSAQSSLANQITSALGETNSVTSWPDGDSGTSMSLGFDVPTGQHRSISSKKLHFRRVVDSLHGHGGGQDSDVTGSPDASVQQCDGSSTGTNSLPQCHTVEIVAVLFPLLARVISAWLLGVAANANRRVAILASGRARPSKAGASGADAGGEGNSTECTAQLMVRFLNAAFANQALTAVALHGDGDAFKYDANLRFCHSQLLPILDAERGDVARRRGADWQKHFGVTLALCDGTHSRLQVLSQCLREYRPEMAHLSRLKAFWHSCDLRVSDVERESYERAFEAVPTTDVATLADPALRLLIAEVIAHRNNFRFAQPRTDGRILGKNSSTGSGDLARFWLRKTQKPVLCVLLVQREGGPVNMHRGINLEVSMPTGSLCSERNVIGTAFAADPSLRREDLRAIAVLAVEPNSDFLGSSPPAGRNPLSPCGACMEWLRKIYEVNPSFRVLTFEDESCQKVFVKTVGRS